MEYPPLTVNDLVRELGLMSEGFESKGLLGFTYIMNEAVTRLGIFNELVNRVQHNDECNSENCVCGLDDILRRIT